MSSETPEAKCHDRMAQPAASGASANHVRTHRSHSHNRKPTIAKTHGQNDMYEKGQKPVSGRKTSKDQKPASGGKESSYKDQKSASGGKANKHDRSRPLAARALAPPRRPAAAQGSRKVCSCHSRPQAAKLLATPHRPAAGQGSRILCSSPQPQP